MPIIGGNQPQASSAVGTDMVKVPNTTFTYSMTRITDLEASEYTLVSLINDVSPSVEPFVSEMEQVNKVVIESCQESPRAANLMIRHSMFCGHVREAHGWKMLTNIKPDDYIGSLKIGGSTALFDGSLEGIEVLLDTGEKLTASKFTVNGIAFIITDGENVHSHATPTMIRTKLEAARQKEKLESLVTILIGVGCGDADDPKTGRPLTPRNPREQSLYDYLKGFQKEAGLTHFLPMKDASKNSLAKLAAFISKSISSQSQALGTGGPSQALTQSANLVI